MIVPTNVKRALAAAAYRALPSGRRAALLRAMFQPAADRGVLQRLLRRHMNETFQRLTDEEQVTCSRQLWSGAAGLSWIEAKRMRYAEGRMQSFLTNVRDHLMDAIADVLGRDPACRTIIEIGTGPGQLLFDLMERLPPANQCIGLDINAAAIEANQRIARARGYGPRLRFECEDASAWFDRQPRLGRVLICSLATLKFFTRRQIDKLLLTVRTQCEGGHLALCEEIVAGSDAERSVYTGNCGFAHDYAETFRRCGFTMERQRILGAPTAARQPQLLCAVASFQGSRAGA